MGIIQNLAQVREVLQGAGSAVGSTAGAFGKAAGQYVCNLYDRYPQWMTGENVDVPGLLSSIRKSFLEEVCGPSNAPPPPPPFTGGQCVCDYYQVFLRVESESSSGEVGVVPEFECRVFGPVQGVSIGTDINGNSTGFINCRAFSGDGCGPQDNYPFLTLDSNNTLTSITFVRVNYAGFGTDNCGNPPPGPAPSPSPSDLNQTYNIDVINNEAPTFNVTIPFAFVDLSPKLDNTFNFNLTLDAGGQSFNLDFGPEGVGGPDSPPPPSPNPEINNRFDVVDRKVDDLTKKTEECCANSNPVKPPEDFDVIDKEPEDPKEETDIELLAYVEVLLTKKPKNSKGQSGGGTGPDVVYAGWFEFKRGTYSFPRSPLHFGSAVFKAPIGADGYAYTLYTGFEGKHTVYKFKKDEI